MKTLEEVIKQKCKFIGNSKEPYELYNLRPFSYQSTSVSLFLTDTTIESDNIITLLEEMTPLLVYIFSCICHCNGGATEYREMNIVLLFPNGILNFEEYLDLGSELYGTPLSIIKGNLAQIEAGGYFMSFYAPFRLEIRLDRRIGRLE